jgi:hypothetical protein
MAVLIQFRRDTAANWTAANPILMGGELAIESDGLKVLPVDISDLFAVEVDFQEDLDRANKGLER